jgi:hypothetical protein
MQKISSVKLAELSGGFFCSVLLFLMSNSEVKTSYSSMVLLCDVELQKRAKEIGI